MLDSLYIGATGMNAQQSNIDTIANNLANVNTQGFKKSRIDFEDLLYRKTSATQSADGVQTPLFRGMGAALSGISKVFTQGDLKKTEQPLDLAIKGQGFFELTRPDGTAVYTRSGTFQLNSDGQIVNSDGYPLAARLQIPADTKSIRIEADGRVLATVAGETQPVDVGQIEVVAFTNPSGLEPMGDNLYLATKASGDGQRYTPGEGNTGSLAQGFLETSNVKLIEEMISLVIAQRAYEMNAKVVQASDDMLNVSNSLYR